MATIFDTTQPSQVKGLGGYTVDPIFTVGDTITGTKGALNSTTAGNYTPIGILDGTGAYKLNAKTVRIFVNHEVGNTAGYAYTLASGAKLTGTRVSYFDIDIATLKVVDSGLAYDTIYNRAGQVVGSNGATLDTSSGTSGLNRFCSANLIEAQVFGANKGFVDTIFFTGEETTGGTEFALDVATGDLWALPWLGRAAWESVTEVDTGNTSSIALIVGDDRSGAFVDLNGDGDTADAGEGVGPVAPLLLYVGTKNTSANANFLERNGLVNGKLYVWVADDTANPSDPIELTPADFFATGANLNGKFVEIDIHNTAGSLAVDGSDSGTSTQDGELGYDSLGFATQGQQDKMVIDAKAFRFSRPEDVSTNPKDGTQVVMASTGNGTAPENDSWGTTYAIDINFNNISTGDITANVKILYAGDDSGNGVFASPDFGLRSPDNLDWADDGFIYLQEDDAVDVPPGFGGASGQEASIWRIDPSAANPAATLTRVAQIDRTGVPATQSDSATADIGNWETSGVLDVSKLFGNDPGELLIFDVQAHSLVNGTIITATNIDGNNNGTATANENLVQGGQLSFLIAPNATLIQSSALVAGGSASADTLTAGVTSGFDGVNDIVFAGAGDDKIDSVISGALASGNRIDAGSGKDTIDLANNDRVFGGEGIDILDASDASGYRASGGAGDDTFYLGSTGRALGGDGDDRFFVQAGGGNLLSGGVGADQFWIFGAQNPASANTVLDFQVGTDVIGLIGSGKTFNDLTRAGNTISLGGVTLATLTGVDTTTLTATSFAFLSSQPA